jgi:molecular chaperone DnaJ
LFNRTASGGLGDLFGGLFGNRAPRPQTARRGADVESEVTIGFVEAVEGATVSLRTTSDAPCAACQGTGAKAGTLPRVCPTCEGAGFTTRNQGGFALTEPCRDCRGRGMVVDDPCPVCHGSGHAPSTRTISVRIPAGVRDGQKIRLPGKGAPGERGGPPGDLFVVVHVRPHPIFGRRGDNLTVTVPVTFPEAALGAEISVPTLGGGPVKLKIPAGTPNGRTFRVRGKGSRRKDGSRGDLLVTVEVIVPEKLDDAARAALEQYKASAPDGDPRASLLAQAARTGGGGAS